MTKSYQRSLSDRTGGFVTNSNKVVSRRNRKSRWMARTDRCDGVGIRIGDDGDGRSERCVVWLSLRGSCVTSSLG